MLGSVLGTGDTDLNKTKSSPLGVTIQQGRRPCSHTHVGKCSRFGLGVCAGSRGGSQGRGRLFYPGQGRPAQGKACRCPILRSKEMLAMWTRDRWGQQEAHREQPQQEGAGRVQQQDLVGESVVLELSRVGLWNEELAQWGKTGPLCIPLFSLVSPPPTT